MKKAISPLISTVVLILFATVLGVLVMGWGKSYSPEIENSCEDTSLKLLTIDNKPLICYSDTIQATIQNNGQAEITGLKISSVGDTITTNEIQIKIPVAEISKVQLPLNPGIKKLIITPKINKNKFCTKNQLEIENIMPC